MYTFDMSDVLSSVRLYDLHLSCIHAYFTK